MTGKVNNYFKSYNLYKLIRENNKSICDKFIKIFLDPKNERFYEGVE